MELPKIIYVHADEDAECLLADADITSLDDDETVGIYELREIKVKRISHALE